MEESDRAAQLQAFKDSLLDELSVKFQPSAGANLKKRGLAMQVEFNERVLKHLDGTAEGLAFAINALKERNALLVAADADPRAFELADTAEKMKSFTKSMGGDSSLGNLLMASQLLNQGVATKKRRLEEQPFRKRGDAAAYASPRNEQGPSNADVIRAIESLKQPAARANAGFGYYPAAVQYQPPKKLQCYNCFQFGHTKYQCKQRRQQ